MSLDVRNDKRNRHGCSVGERVFTNIKENDVLETGEQNSNVLNNIPTMWKIVSAIVLFPPTSPTACRLATFEHSERELRTKYWSIPTCASLPGLSNCTYLLYNLSQLVSLTWLQATRCKSSVLLYLSILTYRDVLIASLKKRIIAKDKLSGRF